MADIKNLRTPAETGLSNLFAATRKTAASDQQIAREEAFRYFEATGLPSRRVEAFKYTDLRAAMKEAAPPSEIPSRATAEAARASAKAFDGIEAVRLTFVNGHLIRELSDLDRIPSGVAVTPLIEALTEADPLLKSLAPVSQSRENPIYQLNTAFMADGVLISVEPGVSVETPIHLRFLCAADAAFSTATRTLVSLGEGSELTVFETHEGQGGLAYQANDVVDAVVADKAILRHTRLNREGGDAIALSTIAARLGAESKIESVNLAFGATLSRHQIYLLFEGENALATVNGAAMLGSGQLADSTLLADHAAVGGIGRQLFKTVIDGESTGVFQGKIIVQQIAQKTDGKMKSDCLLLSEDGQMMNKPELEIFADDVLCGHGATCGQPDEELLFYLMARGLPKPVAESLLVQAFVGEAIEAVSHEGAREAMIAEIEGWLKARG